MSFPRCASCTTGRVIVCTSTTRPTGSRVYPGLMIFETDTKETLVYNGTGWSCLSPRLSTAVGNATSGWSTVTTTLASLTVPARAGAGLLLITSYTRVDKSTGGDQFTVALMDGATVLESFWNVTSTTVLPVTLTSTLAVADNTAKTITVVGARTSGSGTGTTYADATMNRLNALWVPAP